MNSPVLICRVIWDPHPVRFPLRIHGAVIREVHIAPETAWPAGRKGLVLESAWKQLGTDAVGMLLLDGDVVIDPHDLLMMMTAIVSEPAAVHTAATRIWPVSKGDIPGWVWSHWSGKPTQDLGKASAGPDFFSFGFTYIPRAVMDAAIRSGLRSKVFPHVDQHVSATAVKAGVPIRIVRDCMPKHMNY